jgi:hypothetical protein
MGQLANLAAELAPKQLQLLRELMPNVAAFGVLADPAFPTTESTIADLQVAARMLGLQLVVANARTDSDLEAAFASFLQHRVGAVFVGISSFYTRRTEQLAAQAAHHALPTIFPFREFALGRRLDELWQQHGESEIDIAGAAEQQPGRDNKPYQQPRRRQLDHRMKLIRNLLTRVGRACSWRRMHP